MNGEQYSGTFMNDMKHGQGTLHTKESTYIGEFKLDMKDGEGSIVYKQSKNRFLGHWKQDQMHG